jgi:hypothetical protein
MRSIMEETYICIATQAILDTVKAIPFRVKKICYKFAKGEYIF